MAISRWTKARLRIGAVVAAIGAAAGITISWLLSQILQSRRTISPNSSKARATG